MCALATAKLNGILQTKSVETQDEACYLLGKVEGILRRSVGGQTEETYMCLVPLLRTLLSKVHTHAQAHTHIHVQAHTHIHAQAHTHTQAQTQTRKDMHDERSQ